MLSRADNRHTGTCMAERKIPFCQREEAPPTRRGACAERAAGAQLSFPCTGRARGRQPGPRRGASDRLLLGSAHKGWDRSGDAHHVLGIHGVRRIPKPTDTPK